MSEWNNGYRGKTNGFFAFWVSLKFTTFRKCSTAFAERCKMWTSVCFVCICVRACSSLYIRCLCICALNIYMYMGACLCMCVYVSNMYMYTLCTRRVHVLITCGRKMYIVCVCVSHACASERVYCVPCVQYACMFLSFVCVCMSVCVRVLHARTNEWICLLCVMYAWMFVVCVYIPCVCAMCTFCVLTCSVFACKYVSVCVHVHVAALGFRHGEGLGPAVWY